jgi:hypothetical protein
MAAKSRTPDPSAGTPSGVAHQKSAGGPRSARYGPPALHPVQALETAAAGNGTVGLPRGLIVLLGLAGAVVAVLAAPRGLDHPGSSAFMPEYQSQLADLRAGASRARLALPARLWW